MSITTSFKLEPKDRVLCDPEFSPEHLADKKKPNCTIPASVIYATKKTVYVEIIDEVSRNKRAFTNTDRFGSTCLVLIEAVEKQTP